MAHDIQRLADYVHQSLPSGYTVLAVTEVEETPSGVVVTSNVSGTEDSNYDDVPFRTLAHVKTIDQLFDDIENGRHVKLYPYTNKPKTSNN